MFIIEVPLTEKTNYVYYQLYPLPNKRITYGTIIPLSKYLILDDNFYVSTNTPCKEITETTFLCKNHHPVNKDKQAPCEVQLLRYEKNLTNCKRIPIMLNQYKIQKLSKNKFLLAIPNQLVAVQLCKEETENIPLHGTYVLELVPHCQVRIETSILSTYEKSKMNFRVIELPKIDNHISEVYTETSKTQPISLDQIQLDDFKNIGMALNIQKKQIEEITPVIHYDNISFWTIIIYIAVTIALCFLLYRKCFKKSIFKPELEEETEEKEEKASSSHPLRQMLFT